MKITPASPVAGLVLGAVLIAGVGCSSDSASNDTTTSRDAASSGAAGSTSTAPMTTPTTAVPTTTAPQRPEVPEIPAGLSPEPATQELPDGTYTAQINSYNNEDRSLNLNLVTINNDVTGPDGKPYLIEDVDLFTLRELPLASNRSMFLLPDGGGWVAQPVTDTSEFLSAIGNRPDRPTPWDVTQQSVFAVKVQGNELTEVRQIFLP